MFSGPIFNSPIMSPLESLPADIFLGVVVEISDGMVAKVRSNCRGFKCGGRNCSLWSYRLAMNNVGGAFVPAITACNLPPDPKQTTGVF